MAERRDRPTWLGRARHAWGRLARRFVINDPVLAAIRMRYIGGNGVTDVESAQRKVAVGSSIRLMVNSVSSMTFAPYRTDSNGFPVAAGNPSPFFRDPEGRRRGAADWYRQVVNSLAARGNAFGHIVEWDPSGRYATAVVPIHPDRIQPCDPQGRILSGTVPPDWKWKIEGGAVLDRDEVMHLRLWPVAGQILGLSPIEAHAATVGLAISAEKFGAEFFDNGGQPTAVIKSRDPIASEDQAKKIKRKIMTSLRLREPVLLPDGLDYQQISIKPEESQFLDSQKLSNAECARIFGPGVAEILGYDTAGAMTYQNVADRDLHLLKYAVSAYVQVIQEWLTINVTPNGQTVYADPTGSILAMNPLARAQRFGLLTTAGAITPNEIRQVERIGGPVEWGDKPYPLTQLKETETLGADGQPIDPTAQPAQPDQPAKATPAGGTQK